MSSDTHLLLHYTRSSNSEPLYAPQVQINSQVHRTNEKIHVYFLNPSIIIDRILEKRENKFYIAFSKSPPECYRKNFIF